MSEPKSHLRIIIGISILLLIIAGFWWFSNKDEWAAVATNSPETAESSTENSNDLTAVNAEKKLLTEPKKSTMRTLQNFTPVTHTTTLQKTDLVVGAGDTVVPGATVSVHYTGAVAATGEVFQSSKDFGVNPITFPLSGVIKGWTEGIPGMKVGGIRRLVIPAAQAYGATPPPGSGIPANADLVFDVELVATSE